MRAKAIYPKWLLAPAAIGALFLLLPLVAILARTPWPQFWELISSPESMDALTLSIKTCVVTTVVCAVIGTPLAVALGHMPDTWWARVIRTVFTLPMMLPPVVAGLALLMTWGRNGMIGSSLSVMGIEIGFTTIAVVMSQSFVAMPFLVTSLEGAIRSRGFAYERAAAALGASRTRIFFQVSLPMILPAFVSGLAMAFSRALGEFGATITFAGSLQGVTRTMPLAIYLQRESKTEEALALAVVLIVLAIVVLLAANSLAARLPGGHHERGDSQRPNRFRPQDAETYGGETAGRTEAKSGADPKRAAEQNPATGQGPATTPNNDTLQNLDDGPDRRAVSKPRRSPLGTGPRIDVDASVNVRDVHLKLSLPAGELTAIMGPNGAGKSTLLGIIAGTLTPDRGGVKFVSEDSASGSAKTSQPRIVILQQNPLLFPHMTAAKNVTFGLRAAGVKRGVASQRALAELAEVGCKELADRRPDQLSGGQAQRVSIARAMAVTPDVVLLDEPMAGLDESSADHVRALLRRRLATSGATAVLVTHDPVDAQELADSTVRIRYGKVSSV